MVEPIFGVLGALAVSVATTILPIGKFERHRFYVEIIALTYLILFILWGLAFAAGAMIFIGNFVKYVHLHMIS